MTANEEEKIRKIIKQLEEIKLSEFLEFEEDELLEFDTNQDYLLWSSRSRRKCKFRRN